MCNFEVPCGIFKSLACNPKNTHCIVVGKPGQAGSKSTHFHTVRWLPNIV